MGDCLGIPGAVSFLHLQDALLLSQHTQLHDILHIRKEISQINSHFNLCQRLEMSAHTNLISVTLSYHLPAVLSSQWLHLSEFFWITNTHKYCCLTLVCRLLTDLPAVCRFIPFPSFLKITADIQGADPRSAEMSQVLLCFYPHTLNCLLIYLLTTRTHWCGLRNKVSNVFQTQMNKLQRFTEAR